MVVLYRYSKLQASALNFLKYSCIKIKQVLQVFKINVACLALIFFLIS